MGKFLNLELKIFVIFNRCIQITKKSVEEFGLVMNEYGRNIQNLTLFFYGYEFFLSIYG